MAQTHEHDWIDIRDGTAACAVQDCQALRHVHRYTQDTRGRWWCGCGAWTPKPPSPPEQVGDLSGYNQRQPKPCGPRKPSEPRRVPKPVGWR
jgi:hypothetical protein